MNKVAVLMSTYNGEKYLEQQIESILKQKDVQVQIFVRDDSSTDRTIDILEKYKKEYSIMYYVGENLKPAKSFMDLLFRVPLDYEYYAFSDQDDIWDTEKLKVAIDKIIEKEKNNKPTLYMSEQELVDEDLNIIPYNTSKKDVNFYSSIVRSLATGCTMVMNREMVEIIRQYMPEKFLMHDIWIYMLSEALGCNNIYDYNKYIKYRQHRNNACGKSGKLSYKIKEKTTEFTNPTYAVSTIANELLKGYSNVISEEKKEILVQLTNYKNNFKNKIKLLLNKRLKSEKKFTSMFFKIMILFNKI